VTDSNIFTADTAGNCKPGRSRRNQKKKKKKNHGQQLEESGKGIPTKGNNINQKPTRTSEKQEQKE
jgi:hypothetical protein